MTMEAVIGQPPQCGDHVWPDWPIKRRPRKKPGRFFLVDSDLPEIGSQGVVSETLAGNRELNLRQVRALSESFAVSAATFV
jgi:hypothetical protein